MKLRRQRIHQRAVAWYPPQHRNEQPRLGQVLPCQLKARMPGWQRAPTKMLIAVDESCSTATAGAALQWAARNLCGPGSSSRTQVFLITVLPPPVLPAYPVTPMLADISQPWQSPQRARDEEQAVACLKAAGQLLLQMGVPRESLEAHVLDAGGGASGVAKSIIHFAKERHVDMMVLGARGMGAIKRSLVHVLGLGSVSDYCIHNLQLPVIVVRADAQFHHARGCQAPRAVCVAYDSSAQSAYALTWTLQHLLCDGDWLHIITVAVPVPYPLVGEELVSVAALEEQQWQQAKECALAEAQELVTKAGDIAAAMGWSPEHLVTGSLEPEPGANGVAQSIADYARQQQVDLLVVGARGLGSFKRSMMSLVGLGSVSDYLVHNVTSCPVAVIKAQDPGPLLQAATSSQQVPAAQAAPFGVTDGGAVTSGVGRGAVDSVRVEPSAAGGSGGDGASAGFQSWAPLARVRR